MLAVYVLFVKISVVLAEIHYEKLDHLHGKHLIVATADVNYFLFDVNFKYLFNRFSF